MGRFVYISYKLIRHTLPIERIEMKWRLSRQVIKSSLKCSHIFVSKKSNKMQFHHRKKSLVTPYEMQKIWQ